MENYENAKPIIQIWLTPAFSRWCNNLVSDWAADLIWGKNKLLSISSYYILWVLLLGGSSRIFYNFCFPDPELKSNTKQSSNKLKTNIIKHLYKNI